MRAKQFDDGSHNKELLMLHVSTFVPLMIFDIMQEGGVTDRHIREARSYCEIIGSEGDAILYRDKQKGKSARAIHALCRGLAILAFVPGGVTFAGLHFEEKTGQALKDHFARLRIEDFEALRQAMSAEEAREQEVQP